MSHGNRVHPTSFSDPSIPCKSGPLLAYPSVDCSIDPVIS